MWIIVEEGTYDVTDLLQSIREGRQQFWSMLARLVISEDTLSNSQLTISTRMQQMHLRRYTAYQPSQLRYRNINVSEKSS
jgi:hypothetical protein